jgi:hypothetical protein
MLLVLGVEQLNQVHHLSPYLVPVCWPPLAHLHDFYCSIPELKPDLLTSFSQADQISRGFSSTAGVEEKKKS